MDKMPEISDILLSVMEHFEPIARSIHPEASEGFILSKSMALTNDWLGIEQAKSRQCFYEKRGIRPA